MRLPLFLLPLLLFAATVRGGPLAQGPLVGHTSATGALLWARAEWSGAYYLGVRPAGTEGWQVVAAEAIAASDYTLKWSVDGLEPAEEYEYQVFDKRGKPTHVELFRFRTAPGPNTPAQVQMAFGSCAANDESTARVWKRIQTVAPDAVVLLGDTPYIDSTGLAIQRRRYREFLGFAPLAETLSSTSLYATWDDHDFGRNDTDGNLPGKELSRQAFIEYHANPSYGDGAHGIYTSFRRGPIEVFLLDTRYFAATEPSPFAADKPTLLGRAQWDWLRAGLEASTAPFKVLACGMIFNGATRPGKSDHWMSYPHERQALFEFLGDKNISGVVLVSGDIHRSRVLRYATHIGVGYPITELITSPMHGRVIETANALHPDLVRDFGAPNTFLLLSADTTNQPSFLTARFINADGEELHSERFELAQLQGRPYAHADLPPLLEFLDGRKVDTAETWEMRKAELRRLLEKYLIGSYPVAAPAIAEARMVVAKRQSDGSVRRRVRLTLETPRRVTFEIDVWVPGVPGPHPLLLTQPRYYQIAWAEQALARGYVVCLYPGVDSHHREADYPNYQSVWETIRAEYTGASWTEISTKAWIASRALDYLLSPESGLDLAAGQVGIIGFSRYGKQSLIAAAYDERITSVVARSPGSPGSCPYRFTSRNTCAETPTDFPGTWFLPSLRSFTGREHTLPVDAHAWLALIAPRRCLIHTAHNDGSEPTFAVERAYLEAQKVYDLLGARDHLRVQYRPGQHGPITDEHRRQNLDWFDLSFGRGGSAAAFPEELLHDFDWQAWRAAQGDLAASFSAPMATSDDERRSRLRWLLGEPPAEEPAVTDQEFLSDAESQMMTHDRWAVKGVERRRVSFGRNVRGNLYLKSDLHEPAPVVIWLHPYSYHSGYNEGYGVEGTTVYHRLAAAGFTVLAFDQCGFGLRLLEGSDFYERRPRWSRLGRMVSDVHAAVDFLQGGAGRVDGELPPLDPARIGVLGYSVGGMVGLISAALDSRIAFVASFGGFTPLRTDTDAQLTGGNRRLWEWHALLPRLGLFHGREGEIPVDFDDVLMLLAPRPCLIGSPRRDREASFPAVLDGVERARLRWSAAGNPAALKHFAPDTPGRFQKAEQEVFIEWLRTQPASKKD